MAILDDLTGAAAMGFNALREVYFPADATLELLKLSDGVNDFEIIETLYTDWYLKFAKNRQQFELSIARTDAPFTAAINQASNVRINANVYWIEQADILPPEQGKNPVWTLFCNRGFSKGNIGRIY